jgi:hypothetical protein
MAFLGEAVHNTFPQVALSDLRAEFQCERASCKVEGIVCRITNEWYATRDGVNYIESITITITITSYFLDYDYDYNYFDSRQWDYDYYYLAINYDYDYYYFHCTPSEMIFD